MPRSTNATLGEMLASLPRLTPEEADGFAEDLKAHTELGLPVRDPWRAGAVPVSGAVNWARRGSVEVFDSTESSGGSMGRREALHQLIDDLPEQDLPIATRVLEALRATGDPVLRALLSAPIDDEPDTDDFDGGLSESRREASEGQTISHEEVKRELGLS